MPDTNEPKKKTSPWLIGCLGCGVLFVLFIIIGAIVTPFLPETPKTESAVTTAPIVEKKPSEQAKPLTVIDKLWAALDESRISRDNIRIDFNESNKTATLTYQPDIFWDGKHLVGDGYSKLVSYGERAFAIDGVENLRIISKAKFTDVYGKESVENGLLAVMPKSEYLKFEWDNLSGKPIQTQMEMSCSELFIHPAILKGLQTQEIRLVK